MTCTQYTTAGRKKAFRKYSSATAAHPIAAVDELFNPNVVKVVLDRAQRAMYFSRATIPWHRDGFAQTQQTVPAGYAPLRHIGLYAYRNDFLQAYPDIRLDAHFLDRRVDIVAEGFDAVIRLGNLRDSTLTGRELGAFRSQLIASPAYLQRYGEPTHPEQLAAHQCLGFTHHPDWPYWILENGREHIQVTPAGPLTTNISEALLTAVIRATGIALLPGWMVNQAVQCGELVRVLPDWRSAARVSVYALMPPGTLVPAKTRVFIDAVCQQLASSPLWQDELKR